MKRDLRRFISLTLALLALAFCVPAASLEPPYTPSEPYMSGPYYGNLLNVELTGDQRTDIVRVALSQAGYHDGDSFSEMHGLNTGGVGDYAEYCYWFGTEALGSSTGHYGAWCAMFVSWCARMAAVPEDVINNSCWARIGFDYPYYFHLNFVTDDDYTPRPGDLVFFDFESMAGEWNHVALVRWVDEERIYTIEGNTQGGRVWFRNFALDHYAIKGYGVPEYGEDTHPFDLYEPGNYPRPFRDISLGSTGTDVMWLQAALTTLGYFALVSGTFSSGTENALISFQEARGLVPDGICGELTKAEIIYCLTGEYPDPNETPVPTWQPTPSPTAAPSQEPTPSPTGEPSETPDPGETDPPYPPDDDPTMGDIDGDGLLTIYDALLIMRAAMGLEELDPEHSELADVDCSGEVDIFDSLTVMRVSMGLAFKD